jgi:subtilisin-like proprotein convertase family protein
MRRFYCLISVAALIAVMAGALPAGATAPASPPNCPSASTLSPANNTAVPIPTGPGIVTSTIDVSGAGPYLLDVNALTDISHTFSADLDVTLTSPAGTVVTLTTDNGAGNDDVFKGTTWDDSANPAGQVPYTTNDGLVTDQTYANLTTATPLVPEEAMGAFIGENPNGIWTLTVSDDLAGDGGTLNSWGLDLETLPAAPDATPLSASSAISVPIPTGPGIVTSTIDVSGAGPYLLDVNALTDISHTFSADLDVTLTSPAGTVVTLTTDNGAGNDDVFKGTTWDDSANPAGQVPYTTNDGLVTDQTYANLTTATPLVPEEAMGAFIGENPNGIWTLTVSDDLAGDGGTLNSWGLDLKTGSCPVPVPTLSIADAKAKEGDSHATKVKIPVTLSAASASEVGVDFATVKGSAHPGSDFKKAAGRLSFAPGATKGFIKVKVLGDTKHEKTEKFSVRLSSPSNATIADGSGLLKIKKSD